MSKKELAVQINAVHSFLTVKSLMLLTAKELQAMLDGLNEGKQDAPENTLTHEQKIAKQWKSENVTDAYIVTDDMIAELATGKYPVAYVNGRVLAVFPVDNAFRYFTFAGYAGIDKVSGELIVQCGDNTPSYQKRRVMSQRVAIVNWLNDTLIMGRKSYEEVVNWRTADDYALNA